MGTFDINEFNNLLQRYCELKRAHTPYICYDWVTDGKLVEECLRILMPMGELVNIFLEKYVKDGHSFVVRISRGCRYFPKYPWIAVLFNDEKPSQGVYPHISLRETCWYVGCCDSKWKPQGDFSKRYYWDVKKRIDCSILRKNGIRNETHLALLPQIFQYGENVSVEMLRNAFELAITTYSDFRKDPICIKEL